MSIASAQRDARDRSSVVRWSRCRLWTVRRNHRILSAEVVHADRQFQLRFFAQGILFLWHPCPDVDEALEYAEMVRDDLAADRWR